MSKSKLLSEDQKESLEAIKSWFNSNIRSPFRLNGSAGTGKSTIATSISDVLDTGIIYCAPTGKAASVLRSKGVAAGTIHNTIYECEPNINLKKVTYSLKDRYSFNNSLFVVDEASMVNDDLRRDIESLGKKVLYVGDQHQLPPVESCSNHMELSNFSLTKLHRFAEDNPIYTLSHHVRDGNPIKYGKWGEGVERKSKGSLIKCNIMSEYDMVLCGYNDTRTKINNMLREYHGRSGIIVVGDRLMISKNNSKKKIANGDMCTVTHVGEELKNEYLLDVRVLMDGDIEETDLLVDTHNLYGIDINKESKYSKYKFLMTLDKNRVFVEYGYCLTVHKAQGSEYGSVLLIEEPIGDTILDKNKWLYTGITRAKSKLTIGA